MGYIWYVAVLLAFCLSGAGSYTGLLHRINMRFGCLKVWNAVSDSGDYVLDPGSYTVLRLTRSPLSLPFRPLNRSWR